LGKVKKDKLVELEDYPEDFLEKFVKIMGKCNSLDKCKAEAISELLIINGEPEIPQSEIKAIHALLKIRLAKEDKTDPLSVMFGKSNAIGVLQEIAINGKSDELKIKAIEKLTVLNDWLTSSDAKEVIDSNNDVINTLNKLFTVQEQKYLAFNWVDEDAFEPEEEVERFTAEEQSIIDKIEISEKV